ncbi:hypothetical protein BP6252_04792 [Coleophoma cylindrospora]|uniref:WDR59/RTC1-like RING zinc finger domain-containing protein n=1 Tax=Coleophoma cylindrospora TaxID=1849047 RepID=A0A3D8S235_9HELO|nr:hypothetical protein BP6252_04792 [Coleophoma cylindrospora]
MAEESRKGKSIKSAFDSGTFDADVSIYVDRKVGSATISPSGRDVALASTEGLDIIDLDSPLNPPRHLRHGLPWLVADVQWSPFAVRDYWVVSTANQKALVWNLNMQEDSSQGSIEHTLHGHSRAITDINFSAHHPDMLATCAVDGFVHCWDLRRPRQPILTFCDWFAGATQVKYNRQDSHILASSHDRWLRIWDDRMGAAPLRSINAHESKIYGVDWNRTRTSGVVTCSLDKTIKFWDYNNDIDQPERIIRTDFPIWRARHTPFGWGLLAMPQDSPGYLHLYERRLTETEKDGPTPAVAIFPGHGQHKVKEFLWRSRGGITDEGFDNRDFQLVSWGEDNHLRLKRIDVSQLEKVGHVKGRQVHKRLSLTRTGATYKTFRSVEGSANDKKAATISGPRPGSAGLKVSSLTVGMGKVPAALSPRTSTTLRTPAMKVKALSPKGDDPRQKQISWMGGIKISKQERPPGTPKRASSGRFSLLSPGFDDDGDWDAPETLHDEIIRIHSQLPKITFDDVNMDKRKVATSMNGPWGNSGESIYIRVSMSFPEQYPETKAPSFSIGKTSLMSDHIYQKLKKEVDLIASESISRRQGCLERTFRYLLGEVPLEESTTFFDDGDDIDNIDGLADESSSDDEDDIPAGASAMMSQELDSSATGFMLSTAHRNANMPLPRLCGARFSQDGRLVCFFPPKEDKVKSLLGTLIDNNYARNRGEPAFEAFGRLNNNSPGPRNKSLADESRDDSDGSDDLGTSSSSDSDSSRFRVSHFPMTELWRPSARRGYMKALSTNRSQRSSGGGTGTGTGTGTGVSRGRIKPKNIIVLHNTAELLPAKRELAREYAIFGEGPDICVHNAKVAEKHGYQDRADIWRYVAMILHNEVPLEILDQQHRRDPILVVAKDMAKLHRNRSNSGSDSGVDVSHDLVGRKTNLLGRVKWGHNPLARELIESLFVYYEERADIQMLAMLSCVFSEPVAKDSISHAEVRMSQPQTPLSMKTPAFSLDYFPTDVAAWSKFRGTTMSSTATTPKHSHTPVGFYGSVGSSNGAWGSDHASVSYSCGETPPLRSNRASSEQLNYQSQSLSTSPDGARSFRRGNSGLASSFAASFSRPFSLTASSSPPSGPPLRKKPSPVEHMLNSLAPSTITWGNTTVLGSVREQAVSDSAYSDDEGGRDAGPTECTGISMTIENQHAFDDDGAMSSPLLNLSHSAHFSSYRKAYAELLFIWGHQLSRLEVLKFNGLKDYFPEIAVPDIGSYAASVHSNDSRTSDQPPSPIVLGKKSQVHTIVSDQGLDVTGYCLKHDSRLEPLKTIPSSGAIGRCERCKKLQRQLSCVICLEPVSALFTPCLSCRCVSHEHCLAEYHSYGSTMCPGGCDCDCGAQASDGIVESWEVMMAEIGRQRDSEMLSEEHYEEWLKDQWETIGPKDPSDSPGKGYSTLSKRVEQVKKGDLGKSGLKKRSSSIKTQ